MEMAKDSKDEKPLVLEIVPQRAPWILSMISQCSEHLGKSGLVSQFLQGLFTR
jgi:hypothetical protein